MKIDTLLLADVLAGHVEDFSSGRTLHNEINSDPRLRHGLWFLARLSRTPGKLHDALARLYIDDTEGRDENSDYYYGPNNDLDNTLRFLCESDDPASGGKFPKVIKTNLYKLMAEQAEAAKAALAETKVSKLIFKELDLAMHHKVPVPIIGDSRFGKTKGASSWCETRPGQACIVTCPDSNRDWDFFAAHADGLDIEYSARTTLQRLKRDVEWVAQHAGRFICYDEAHYLIPVNYCKDTPPKRINWVRSHVIDKGIGCAFFATPQSHDQTLEKYAAKTKYNLEQWIGRLAPPVILADYYDREELMAVAKVHFPDFQEKLLALICARAMQSEAYLKGMEFTARYASALAQQRGHRTPTVNDVEEAIARMMPGKSKGHGTGTPTMPVATPRKQDLTRRLSPISEGAGTGLQSANFTSRRPGIVADLDTDEPLHADRSLVPA